MSMSDQDKAIVCRFFREIDRGNVSIVDELCAPNHLFHTPGSPPLDATGHKQLLEMHRSAFADWTQSIEDMIAEGDKVVTRFTFRATHKGDLMGIPATGKQIAIAAVAIDRLAGGKIVEEWTVFDSLGMLQQLGVAPLPRAPSTQKTS
jgi:steroid delta-isomerase-like uncharacterized protein